MSWSSNEPTSFFSSLSSPLLIGRGGLVSNPSVLLGCRVSLVVSRGGSAQATEERSFYIFSISAKLVSALPPFVFVLVLVV